MRCFTLFVLSILSWNANADSACIDRAAMSAPNAIRLISMPSEEIPQRQQIAITFNPSMLEVGQIFSILVEVCDASDFAGERKWQASAVMPAHNHGMNYRPRFEQQSANQYLGTGFVFHMPGVWKLQLVLEVDGKTWAFEQDITL